MTVRIRIKQDETFNDMLSSFFAAIDTPGGHICVCVVLIMIGGILSHFGVNFGNELMVGSFAIMGRSMYAANGKGIVGIAMPQSRSSAANSGGASSSSTSTTEAVTITRFQQDENPPATGKILG